MFRPDFRYLVLWLFLFGIIIIVFLQVLSGYNIKRLIEGNKSLLNELQFQNNLRKLASDVIIVESDVRGAVITGQDTHLRNIETNNRMVTQELANLKSSLLPPIPPEAQQLERLVREKSDFNQEILDMHRANGKAAAELLISTNKGMLLRDSILQVISVMQHNRQVQLRTIVGSIESTGKKARLWGFVITVIALIALILSFWYITNQGRQQQRMIQALNESEKRSKDVAYMKEQFLANMSHEIRTPMNAILGFTSLLRRTELAHQQREYVQNIHSAGENLLTLVNDILDVSKIEAGMMQLEETRFSLRSMISSVGAMFLEKLKEKNLAFDVHIDKDVPDILVGDAIRLTQILVNLISNAVKFTESGSVAVKAEAVSITENDVRIRFIVSDTGIGIAPAKQKTVFERFQQAEAETSRRFGGTGLGLSIVKQLVEMQQGSIELQSEPGKGSEFIVELPFRQPDLAQIYSEAMAEQEEHVPLQKIRVLIAEDNAMNQHLVRHLMKSWSIEHTIVSNGIEAVEALKNEPYSIVLMDIQMPEMDGYTATSIIRKELGSDVPVIAMTAHAMVGEKEKCLHLGMNDYVSKPIKETVLYNMIARHAQHIPSATTQLVKLEYLEQLSGNDKDFEREILQQFLVQMPHELQQLKDHIQSNDFDMIRRVAHSMKSTVGYVGLAEGLHPSLEQIEKDAVAGENRHFYQNFSYVKQTCEQAAEEVKMLLSNGSL